MTGDKPVAGRSLPLICLLLHENEPYRPSATHPLIKDCLPETLIVLWQRCTPDPRLLSLLTDPAYAPCLIFPADRPETSARQISRLAEDRRPLLIIPDGTWKEVRKIVRKSPYLAQLPVFSLHPEKATRYQLRRNPDAGHICTSEVVAQLIAPYNAALSEQLEHALEDFQTAYYDNR